MFVKLLVRQPPGLPDLFLRPCSVDKFGPDSAAQMSTDLSCRRKSEVRTKNDEVQAIYFSIFLKPDFTYVRLAVVISVPVVVAAISAVIIFYAYYFEQYTTASALLCMYFTAAGCRTKSVIYVSHADQAFGQFFKSASIVAVQAGHVEHWVTSLC